MGAKAEIQALVSELASRGLSVVLISSDLEEVVEGSDALVILRDGAVVGSLQAGEVSAERVVAAHRGRFRRPATSSRRRCARSSQDAPHD